MSLKGKFFRCGKCNKYYGKEQLQVNFYGHKIMGCPKCLKLDDVKEVPEEEYMRGMGYLKDEDPFAINPDD